MLKVFAGLMSIGLLAVLAAPSDAWGGHGGGCGGCGYSCGYSGCGDCGGCGGCQQYEVVWETRTVNVCEAHYETRQVMRQVCRCVAVQEQKTCTVMVSVSTPEQRTCTVMVPVSTPEVRTVTCYHTVYSQHRQRLCAALRC